MSKFVRDSKYVVHCLLIIEQYVRMRAVTAPTVCAASLSFILVYVYPTLRKGSIEQFAVLVAKRSQRLFDKLASLVILNALVYSFGDRHVQVVHIQLFISKLLSAIAQVSVKRRDISVYAIQQSAIYVARHVFAARRSVKTTLIFAHLRIKYVLFDVADI